MEAPNLGDPACKEQVIKLLSKGGAPRYLDDCECLVDCVSFLLGDELNRGQRQAALRQLVNEVLDSDYDNPQLLAAREYLGWASHSYEEVTNVAGKAGVAHAQALDERASEEE